MQFPSPSRLRIGFVGGGLNSAVGRVHFCATQLDRRYELVAGCFSRHEQTNLQSGQFYGVDPARIYPTLGEMLAGEREHLDTVLILTPTPEHLGPILQTLAAGLPVICEKALVATIDEAERVCLSRSQQGGFLVTTFNYTGYPCIRELRAMVQEGRLGKIRHFIAEMPQEGFLRSDHNGSSIQPQAWRLKDGPIPTVYLDLGTHLHQIMYYLTGCRPVTVSAFHESYGSFPDVIDYVSASAACEQDVHGQFIFGKSMIGNRNGLRIRLYGDSGSAEWEQTDPEKLILHYRDGRTEILDRGHGMGIASLPRYNRFKPGHPAGYIEAFANLYNDIYDCLQMYKMTGTWASAEVFDADFAREGILFLQTMASSARTGARLSIPLF